MSPKISPRDSTQRVQTELPWSKNKSSHSGVGQGNSSDCKIESSLVRWLDEASNSESQTITPSKKLPGTPSKIKKLMKPKDTTPTKQLKLFQTNIDWGHKKRNLSRELEIGNPIFPKATFQADKNRLIKNEMEDQMDDDFSDNMDEQPESMAVVKQLNDIKEEIKIEIEEVEEEDRLSALRYLLGTEIPHHIEAPETIRVERSAMPHNMVALGVETTSLDLDCHIIQLTCSDLSTEVENDFNIYVTPEENISIDASDVNGLTIKDGILMQNGSLVETTYPLEEALRKLLSHLQKDTILISHNTKHFQSDRLVQSIKKCNLEELLQTKVLGFSDTYKLYLDLYPRKTGEIRSYKLWDLIEYFSHGFKDSTFQSQSQSQRNNMEKIRNLSQLLRLHKLTDEKGAGKLYEHSITTECVIQQVQHRNMKETNFASLKGMIACDYLKKEMAIKIASSGLALKHLILAFQADRDSGLSELLNPRITKRKFVIKNIRDYFLNVLLVTSSSEKPEENSLQME